MKDAWNRILTGIMAVLLLCTWHSMALASEVPDLTRDGSVSVTMEYEGRAVAGGSLTIYHVGEVQEDDGNYSFVCCGDFAGCGYSLDDVESQTLVDQLVNYAKAKNIRGTEASIGKDGTVVFQGLTPGLYLFVQTQAAKGYEKAEPFLVSMPMLVDGSYVYDVDASPKLEPIKKSAPPDESETPPDRPSGSRLPQTGQLWWPVPLLVCSGMLLVVYGWMRRKNADR